MTNEEREKQIRIANMLIGTINDLKTPMLIYQVEKDVTKEALENYIKMLEQQPCEDCFTDEEKRIFLASVAREMRVCEVIDSEKTKVKLVPILERVKDKVLRSSLWKEVEE